MTQSFLDLFLLSSLIPAQSFLRPETTGSPPDFQFSLAVLCCLICGASGPLGPRLDQMGLISDSLLPGLLYHQGPSRSRNHVSYSIERTEYEEVLAGIKLFISDKAKEKPLRYHGGSSRKQLPSPGWQDKGMSLNY